MRVAGMVLQLDGALPVVGVLLALIAVAVLAFAVRDDAGYQSTAGVDDDVVCPRCHHSTDGATGTCPECGYDL
ncbi:hypothetical protein ACFQL1_19685 [Halomicroarcula sp. GCM10025709]|uniref:hypothetical protein n=1 Tax=Haloarcula TaxID=2237 RepID=UPI0024C3AA39|nr:hypothetical protein [Halomicroarcula sp. YJ-61-S]